MGVPAFYKWLSTRYPKIVVDAVYVEPTEVDGVEVPVDGTKPNPNGEFDNLYLDMNGIIHPCFHPEDQAAPTTLTECFALIFKYIDGVMNMVRPRNILYMAIDGVAPRAKMNQQRGRRFRSAKDAEEKLREEDAIREELRAEGVKVKEKEPGVLTELGDSNVITPGTPFMAKLSVALQYYIHTRLNTEPMWRKLKVILSDANVPGEGEHKIMQFVREQRGRPGWNPNTRHCIYGLDADLIMLSLATHEPHFSVLREVVFFRNMDRPQHEEKKSSMKPHQFLRINILREYLIMELNIDNLPFQFDPERALDDFVFLCFFVGNDFLPHSPTLEIREGGIDLLMNIYKSQLGNMGGYICDGPKVDLFKAEVIAKEVAKIEGDILKMRMKKLQQDKSRRRNSDKHERNHSRRSGKQNQNAEGRQTQERLRNSVSRKGKVEPADGPQVLGSSLQGPKVSEGPQRAGKTLERASQTLPESTVTNTPKILPSARSKIPRRTGGEGPQSFSVLLVRSRSGQTGGGQGSTLIQQGCSMQDQGNVTSFAKRKKRNSKETNLTSSAAKEPAPDPSSTTPGDADQMVCDDDNEGNGKDDGVRAGDETAMEGSSSAKTKFKKNSKKDEIDVNEDPLQESVERKKQGEDASMLANSNSTAAATKNHEAIWAELANLGGSADYQLPSESKPGEVAEREAALSEKRVQSRLKEKMMEKSDMFEEMVEHEETIAFGDDGWKERYYRAKYPEAGDDLSEIIQKMVHSYVEGLCWVMAYYYDGVPSWKWFYPFHYAPFATDMQKMSDVKVSFKLGEPFPPLLQLMGVLPAPSRHCLPEPLQHLLVSPDSPIIEYYPSNFKCDMNGKRFAWMAVVLLPFIDESKLQWACKGPLKHLTEEEKDRNQRKLEQVYCNGTNPLATTIHDMAYKHASASPEKKLKMKQQINPDDTDGVNGCICLPSGDYCPSVMPAPFGLGEDIETNTILCAVYMNPSHQQHKSEILEGTTIETGTVEVDDIPPEVPLWHETGRTPTDIRTQRARQEQRARVAPEAAQRIMHHHIGRQVHYPQQRQQSHRGDFSEPSPPDTVPPEVTRRAMQMVARGSNRQHPRPPQVPPQNVTEAAIRLAQRTQHHQMHPLFVHPMQQHMNVQPWLANPGGQAYSAHPQFPLQNPNMFMPGPQLGGQYPQEFRGVVAPELLLQQNRHHHPQNQGNYDTDRFAKHSGNDRRHPRE